MQQHWLSRHSSLRQTHWSTHRAVESPPQCRGTLWNTSNIDQLFGQNVSTHTAKWHSSQRCWVHGMTLIIPAMLVIYIFEALDCRCWLAASTILPFLPTNLRRTQNLWAPFKIIRWPSAFHTHSHARSHPLAMLANRNYISFLHSSISGDILPSVGRAKQSKGHTYPNDNQSIQQLWPLIPSQHTKQNSPRQSETMLWLIDSEPTAARSNAERKHFA